MYSQIFNPENECGPNRKKAMGKVYQIIKLQPFTKAFALTALLLFAGKVEYAQCNNFKLHNSDNPLKNFKVASGIESHPFFVDIDGDGDLDCFSGEYTFNTGTESKIYFFRNEGTAAAPVYKKISGAENPFNNLSLPVLSLPSFVDIDADGDYDCFIGDGNSGALRFYKNEGTAKNPVFEKQSAALNPLSLVKYTATYFAEPAFADIDGDGDIDCLVTDLDGNAHYFKNTGTAKEPFFEHLNAMASPFSFLKNYEAFGPSFYDWDNDGLVDLFLGNKFYKNTGTKNAPSFSENATQGPKFSNGSYLLPLRWVNLNNANGVGVVTGTASGSFNYFSTSTDVSINPEGKKVIAKNASFTINVAPNSSAYTYQWLKNGEAIPGATRNDFKASTSGNYAVEVKGTCGTATSREANIVVGIDNAAGIPEVATDNAALNIQAYPNPTKDEFSVKFPESLLNGTIIRVTDIFGKVVESKKSAGSSFKFGKQFVPGVYFLQVIQADKLIHQQKLIKD